MGDARPPLAERMRPRALEELVGQEKLLGPDGILARAVKQGTTPSLVLWGPPGSGKTTLARLLARHVRAEPAELSAVLGGLPELREIVTEARRRRDLEGRRTLLFVDEIHRFHKGQQDAFLPHVEDGTIVLVGATTENPSFALTAALLSRCRVLRLEPLAEAALGDLVERALRDRARGLGELDLRLHPEARRLIARLAQHDARRALGLLETAAALLSERGAELTVEIVERAHGELALPHDRGGDLHHDLASALIKSMRATDPDAAVYYLMRLVEAGEDPLFLLRRLVIFASEDVGNADPRALSVAVDADAAFRRLGLPEGLYALAQACLFLASCPKSDSVGRAFQGARDAVRRHGALPVPLHLRNAPTRLLRDLGAGRDYENPHAAPGHARPAEDHLPDALRGTRFYEPGDQGLEARIEERLRRLGRGGRNPGDGDA